jgi:TetR/AcrR family transcriptional regulator
VGIQEIVHNARISKPTLYHYFGNKEGLYAALLEEEFENLLKSIKAEIQSEMDISLKLRAIVALFLNRSRNNRPFFRIYLSIIFSPPESAESVLAGKYIRKIYSLIENMFIDASYSHGNMRGRHKNYCLSFIGLVNTYILLLLNDEVELDEALVYSIVHQFSHGIYS